MWFRVWQLALSLTWTSVNLSIVVYLRLGETGGCIMTGQANRLVLSALIGSVPPGSLEEPFHVTYYPGILTGVAKD